MRFSRPNRGGRTPSEGKGNSMKINKKLAATVAAAVAVGGLATLGLGSNAQAASLTIYQNINNTGLSPTIANLGTKTINLTVTPSSGNVGAALEVTVSSPNLQFDSGPASPAQPYASRIDAVINFNGADYLLAGPRPVVTTPVTSNPAAGESIIDGGWVVSSNAGSSSGTTTNTTSSGAQTATTGEGTFAINSSGVVSGSAGALTIPSVGSAPPGTSYTVTLRTILNNSVSNYAPPCAPSCTPAAPAPSGTGTNNANDGFDSFYNNASTPSPYASVVPTNSMTTATVLAIGPNAAISSVTGITATNAVRPPLPPLTGYTNNPTNIALTGTTWDANVTSGGFTASFCNTSGASCDTPAGGTVTNTLVTDGSGNVTGNVVLTRTSFGSFLTTGNRAIKLVQGTNTYLVPILVLGTPAVTASPTSGGPGTVVTATGSEFNPLEPVVARGGNGTGYGTTTLTWLVTADAATSATNANSTGGVVINFTVQATDTNAILLLQNNTSGAYSVNSAGTQRAQTTFLVNQDRCIAQAADTTGGSGCNTKQNVNVSVLQGQLVQRAYTNSTPTTGSSSSAATTPVAGTSNVNANATTINLGTVTSPLAPKVIVGNLNDITVSDNRGGTFGWSLSAAMPSFTGTPSGTIANTAAVVTSTCAAASNSTAYDYSNASTSPVAISGFDDTLNASGASAGATSAALGSTINLCTKNTTTNATTGSTGGVYNVGGTITLTVPAFQKAAVYVTTMTITLV